MKKGLSMKFWVGLIIVLACLILFFSYTQLFGSQLEDIAKEDLCRFSVLEHSKLKYNGLDFSEEIVCPTEQITIKGDLRKKEAQESAKRKIADSMAKCWSQFGEGKLNLFQGEGIFCAVCSVIEFENPRTPQLSGFVDYFYVQKRHLSYFCFHDTDWYF